MDETGQKVSNTTRRRRAIATITLTIPDAQLPRVRAALCADAGLPDSNANAKEAVIQFVKATVARVEYAAAVDARAAVVPPDTTGIVT